MTASAPQPSEQLPPPSNRATSSRNRPSGAITCIGCDRWWTGLASAHCSACHETFTGVTNFDAHRVGGQCRKPPGVGLMVASRVWFGWGWPGSWSPDDDTDT